MNKLLRVLLLTVAVLSLSVTAQTKNRLELGVGGFKSTDYLDLLFKVEDTATFGESAGENDVFVIVKMGGDGSIYKKEFSYLDVGFDITPAIDVEGDIGRFYLGYNLVSFKMDKNIDLDQGLSYKLSFVGFKAGGHVMIADDTVRLFAQFSADLYAQQLMDIKRVSDNAGLSPAEFGARHGSGMSWLVGMDLFKNKLKFVFGSDTSKMGSVVNCIDTADGQECYDHNLAPEASMENWKTQKFYFEATAKLTKTIALFGKASYQMFQLTDATEYYVNSNNSQWQFMFGAKFQLFTKKS